MNPQIRCRREQVTPVAVYSHVLPGWDVALDKDSRTSVVNSIAAEHLEHVKRRSCTDDLPVVLAFIELVIQVCIRMRNTTSADLFRCGCTSSPQDRANAEFLMHFLQQRLMEQPSSIACMHNLLPCVYGQYLKRMYTFQVLPLHSYSGDNNHDSRLSGRF